MEKLDVFFKDLFEHNKLIKLIASSPRQKSSAQKVTLKPVTIQKQLQYQWSSFQKDKVLHQNLGLDESYKKIIEELCSSYKQILIQSPAAEYQILLDKKLQPTFLTKEVSKPLPLAEHNRKKKRILEEGEPIPFLIDLGIMNSSGKVLAPKYDKFKQINRYLELVGDCLHALPKDRTLQIIDFGCGKAYLTFALYYYLVEKLHLSVNMLGLDLKKDVIEFCQKTAKRYGWDHLHFAVGDINEQKPKQKIDLIISLHACDTATDAALEKAVQWDAEVILAVPCCQHEVATQIKNEQLEPLLKHGILKERFAALVTDAARAQLLEIQGYTVQVLEFIDMEHTPKNILLRAIKKKTSPKESLQKDYAAFKKSLNINPSLEVRFSKKLK